MKKLIVKILATGGVIFGISYLLPSLINVADFQTAVLAALVLALVNAVIRPLVLIVTLPVNFLSLGLFTFIVNALMLYVVANVVGSGFHVRGFWQAIIAALLISAVSTWLSSRLDRK